MINQKTHYSDIAAVLKHNTANQNATASNKNISSVLSQIQDDGPAHVSSGVNFHPAPQAQVSSTPKKTDSLINLRSETSDKASGKQTNELFNNNNKQSYLSSILGLNKKKTAWLQPSLIAFVAVLVVFFLLRIDARTNQLEVSLNELDAEVLDTVDSYTNVLSPKFRSIKKTLRALQQDLDLIKIGTLSTAPEEKPDALMMENLLANGSLQHSPIYNNISNIENELLALKSELKVAKDKLKMINQGKGSSTNSVTNEHTAITAATSTKVPAVIATTGWVANIASFTRKNQANKALEVLYAAGLSPMLQQVNVNGRRIYRVVVDGFDSRADAKSFVYRADHEFGLPGGWIRKS